jgi:putative phosphoribosyl transferase
VSASRAAERFRDREDAGQSLGVALKGYHGRRPVVLGIPRGGVPIAVAIARQLDGECDVFVARKLGAPGYPELAIGAVTAEGERVLNQQMIAALGVDEEYVRRVTEVETAEAKARALRFRGETPPIEVKDRVVILCDDGIATGATIRAGVQALRQRRPARLIVAVPVGSREACRQLRQEADEVVALMEPDDFRAVSCYYEDFFPVSDEEVVHLLRQRAHHP